MRISDWSSDVCSSDLFYKEEPVDFQQTLDSLLGFADIIKPMVADVTERLRLHLRRGDNVLFEGAQGALLDVDHGTYPYVTRSEEHTSELQSLMRISYAVFCLKKKKKTITKTKRHTVTNTK